jgi:hypothetical protein
MALLLDKVESILESRNGARGRLARYDCIEPGIGDLLRGAQAQAPDWLMADPDLEGPPFVDELIEYRDNFRAWLRDPRVWSVILAGLAICVTGLHERDTSWAVLIGIATLVFACLPPAVLAKTRVELEREWWRLAVASGAGIAVGLIGWQAGLGYGALAMLAILLTVLADLRKAPKEELE